MSRALESDDQDRLRRAIERERDTLDAPPPRSRAPMPDATVRPSAEDEAAWTAPAGPGEPGPPVGDDEQALPLRRSHPISDPRSDRARRRSRALVLFWCAAGLAALAIGVVSIAGRARREAVPVREAATIVTDAPTPSSTTASDAPPRPLSTPPSVATSTVSTELDAAPPPPARFRVAATHVGVPADDSAFVVTVSVTNLVREPLDWHPDRVRLRADGIETNPTTSQPVATVAPGQRTSRSLVFEVAPGVEDLELVVEITGDVVVLRL